MQEFISTPSLFFTIFFISPPTMLLSIFSPPHSSLPSPMPKPLQPVLCTSRAAGSGAMALPTIMSRPSDTSRDKILFSTTCLQLFMATADWTVWGTFSWTVQSLPGPRLWKIQGLAHAIPLWRIFSETLHCLWQQGKDRATKRLPIAVVNSP